MSKQKTMYFVLMVALMTFITAFIKPVTKNNLNLTITFLNTANGKPVILKDSIYITPFNESYTITKLKYYISNIVLNGNYAFREKESYHLIDASRNNSFSLSLPAGKYSSLSFIAGVDSARNCSGAQSGALDPLNDMFWTWSTGYVMFKLEGRSSSSKSDLNRIEHHIGGYRAPNSTIKVIQLFFTLPLEITDRKKAEIFIQTNIDNYWKGVNEIKIIDIPVNTTAGEQAKRSADNFPGMFSLIKAF